MAPAYDPVRTPLAATAEFGKLEIDGPSEIEAGSVSTWKLIYTAGTAGIESGGSITLFTEGDSD